MRTTQAAATPHPPLLPGIAIRESFNENSTSALLATGILDSLSAGVLLYVVLVQLMAPMLTDSAWLHAQRWYLQVGGGGGGSVT
jgi:zinc transporter 1/2/3